jgi:hypothetical protein
MSLTRVQEGELMAELPLLCWWPGGLASKSRQWKKKHWTKAESKEKEPMTVSTQLNPYIAGDPQKKAGPSTELHMCLAWNWRS